MRALSHAVLLGLLLLGPLPATARELTRDEVKWARVCLRNLGANSARVRRGAEAALIELGADVLGTVLANLDGVKGRAAEAGLGRVLAGIGRKTVARWVASERARNKGAPSRRLARIEALVGGVMVPGETLEVVLAPTRRFTWRRVPFAAEQVVGKALPRRLAGADLRAEHVDGGLRVDADADGTLETTLAAGEARRLEVGLGRADRPLWVYDKLGTWHACSASVQAGAVGELRLEVWDADLDGRFDGPGDYVRVGGAGWIRQRGAHRVALPKGPAGYAVRGAGDALVLELTPEARPEGIGLGAWRALAALNAFRSDVGLPALAADTERTRACERHAAYLARNAGDGPEVTAGGNTHGEDPARPGYTEEGDTAGRSSNISPGDLVASIGVIAATMLHRINWLGPSTEGVGLGYARRGKQAWSVMWSEEGSAMEPGAPIAVPAPGQEGIPRRGGGEWPPPDAPPGFYEKRRGFPVSVTFAPQALAEVSLALYLEDGTTPVPGHLWTPARPIAHSHAMNNGSAFFMPARPLERRRRYWAVFRARRGGTPVQYAWTFKTR